MKTRIGFTVYECAQSAGGYRHLQVDVYPLFERYVGRELVGAVERGSEWERNHLSDIVRAAGGRRVFEGDHGITLQWQSSADFAHWYAMTLGVHSGKRYGRPELFALQSRIIKLAASMESDSAPVDWLTALDAVPIERVRRADGGLVSGLWTFADFDTINTAIWGPDGKVKPAAAAEKVGDACAA